MINRKSISHKNNPSEFIQDYCCICGLIDCSEASDHSRVQIKEI